MKNFSRLVGLFLLFIFTGITTSKAQLTIWSEDFEDESVNATTGNDTNNPPVGNDWTSSFSGTPDFFQVRSISGDKEFVGKEIDGAAVWSSETIDVSGKEWYVELRYSSSNNDWWNDYFEIYFDFDGTGETLVYDHGFSGNQNDTQLFSSVFEGYSTVQIVVRMNNGANDEQFSFDDIGIYEVEDIYSINSGNWSDGTNWSAISNNGATCNCTPNDGRNIIIGDGDNITLDTNGEVVGVNITNGSLIYGGNFNLNIERGGDLTIASGSSINANGNTGSSLTITSANAADISIDGSLSSGDLIFDAGPTLNITGTGSINILDDVLINADDVTITNGLDFTINDDLIPSTYVAFFTFAYDDFGLTNNNTLTINGDFNGNTDSFGNGDFLITNNGTLNHAGNYTNIDAGSSFVNSAGATWNWTGATADIDMNSALNAFSNGNIFNYNRAGAQDVIGTTYDDVNFNNSGTKTTIGNLDINGNLTITGTAQLNVDTGDDNINLVGSWTVTSSNANPFIEGAGTETVIFDGGSIQTISNALGSESFNNVTLSKSGGSVRPSATNLDVAGTLNMTSGNIQLGTNNLILGNAASITNASSASFVITNSTGTLTQTNIGGAGRTGDIVFPVGKTSGSYTPITINNDAGTADNFIIRVCQDVYEEATCETGTVVNTDVVDRTWFISESVAGGSDATLTFQWNTANEASGFDRSNILFKHHNGSIWETIGAGSATAVGGGAYAASVANVSNFSPFAIEDGDSPLPVELISFTAKNNNGEIDIEWVTASEINNDYFILERSVDAKSYEELAIITGNGTTNKTIVYDYTDVTPYGGTSYYRLTQVDYDGTTKVYEPVKVEVALTGEIFSYVHPVPSNGDFINVQLSGFDKSLGAQLKIINIKGETMYTQDIFLDENTNFNEQIRFGKKLPTGMYILNITTPEPIIKRIMVK